MRTRYVISIYPFRATIIWPIYLSWKFCYRRKVDLMTKFWTWVLSVKLVRSTRSSNHFKIIRTFFYKFGGIDFCLIYHFNTLSERQEKFSDRTRGAFSHESCMMWAYTLCTMNIYKSGESVVWWRTRGAREAREPPVTKGWLLPVRDILSNLPAFQDLHGR